MIINPDTGLPTIDRVNWKLICANCGKDWGHNHTSGTGVCMDVHGRFLDTTFKLATNPSKWLSCPTEIPWKYTESAKPKSRECPCGIARVDCDYHK